MKNKLGITLLALMSGCIHFSIDASAPADCGTMKTVIQIERISQATHQTKKFQCPECDCYESNNKANFDRHMLSLHQINAHSCPRNDCNKVFPKARLLKAHILKGHAVSKEEIAQYLMIDSRCSSKDDLICPDCHETFSRLWRGNFHRHLKTWHNIKPFVCMGQDCLQGFNTEFELKNHSNVCDKKKSYSLPVVAKLLEKNDEMEDVFQATVIASHSNMSDDFAHDVELFNSIERDKNVSPLNVSPFSQMDLVDDSQLGL